ncbi:hypothetical protein E2C01_101588 [Portunus trituberculatus]|uniref:Uncharacterized protein n=1 Tax=Portunus trituberculatus TaxID=210409 RepID=A0A5B7KF89_PORTR|nr:hypothetical protein [Portunus trituberculatus]
MQGVVRQWLREVEWEAVSFGRRQRKRDATHQAHLPFTPLVRLKTRSHPKQPSGTPKPVCCPCETATRRMMMMTLSYKGQGIRVASCIAA